MPTIDTLAWLKNTQAQAAQKALELGLPHSDLEGWKYTSLKKLNIASFRAPTGDQSGFTVSADILDKFADADYRLYFYNGAFLSSQSKTNSSEDIMVLPLARALQEKGRVEETVRLFLERAPNPELGGLGEINQSQFREGAFIHLNSKENVRIALVHLYGPELNRRDEHAALICPRHVIYLAQNSVAEIAEVHSATGVAGECLVNTATDLILDREARGSYAQVFTAGENSSFFSDTQMRVNQGAELQMGNLSFGGRVIRNEIVCDLLEPRAAVKLFSAFATMKDQHIDNSSFIHHIKGETQSRHTVKGVASGHSRAVFSGRLVIDQDAQKSDAAQLNQSLLLSKHAEVDSRPQLEVFADDVKAAHGASVGEISAEEIFYLTSRGIPRDEARHMLGRAYVSAVTDSVESPFLKKVLAQSIQALSEDYFSEGGAQ
jgi:Fe-S cluster assembly protein SufD